MGYSFGFGGDGCCYCYLDCLGIGNYGFGLYCGLGFEEVYLLCWFLLVLCYKLGWFLWCGIVCCSVGGVDDY